MRRKNFAVVLRQSARKVLTLLPARLAGVYPILLLTALACAVCSCSSFSPSSAHTTQYAGVPQQPPIQPANVKVLRYLPAEPSQQLGEIVLLVPTDSQQTSEQVEAKLREEAGKLGADAVVVVDDRIQPDGAAFPPGWYFTGEIITDEKIVGKAIKYQPLTPTGRAQ
jgi:hypothetical protein